MNAANSFEFGDEVKKEAASKTDDPSFSQHNNIHCRHCLNHNNHPIKMSAMKCITLVSTLLLASAQLSTFPRRLRRGALSSSQEKEFGRQLEDMSMSLSMPSSMSVDLTPAGMDFLPVDFGEEETASVPEVELTTSEPSYYPTVSFFGVVRFKKEVKEIIRINEHLVSMPSVIIVRPNSSTCPLRPLLEHLLLQ